jgi:formyl-CoA transferase
MAALDGLRVLDMTQYEAGTSCTQWLAWLGAEVVKVEGPTGDPGRYTGKGLTDLPGDPQYFTNYNGNKQSVVLNLKTPRGRQLLMDLVPHFDVFVENYGPGVIEALDIGPEVLRKCNPGLIYTRIKGFGLSGPYKDFKVYDWVAQAAAGTFSVTGEPDRPPTVVGPTMGDSGTGIQAAFAILGAYIQKQRTGEGQTIEVSMQEAVTMFMRTVDLVLWGKEPAERHGLSRGRAGGGLYPCKGGGPNDWAFIYPATTRMLDALWVAMDRPELGEDPRFNTAPARAKHAAELREEITSWTLQRDKREVMTTLGAAGVPCSYVFDTMDLFTDPHLAERGFIKEIDHPVNGPMRLMRHPLRMSGTVEQDRAPLLGEHTDDVLARVLGLDEAALAVLRAEDVTQERPYQ